MLQVCPPVLVLSPSADRLFYALENHPSLQTISKFLNLIISTASEKIVLQETDAASANERLYNHRLNVSNDDILREIVVCHNHQNNLAEGSLVATTHKSLISDFFSFTHFVQAGTHFTKLKRVLREYICQKATINVTRSEAPPLDDLHNQYLEELLDMHCKQQAATRSAHNQGTGAHSLSGFDFDFDAHTLSRERLRKKRVFLRHMWNQDGIGHTCCRHGDQKSWCCQSDEDAKQKLATALIDFGLSSLPETPAPGKWTKLWSCLQLLSNHSV